MKKITLLGFILFTLALPFDSYAFGGSSISINIQGINGSFRYSEHSYQRIHHRPVIRHHRGGGRTRGYARGHARGHARGYARHGYRQGYRQGYRDGYRDGYYNNYPPVIYSPGNAYWRGHSPAAYRREVYISERAYRHGREW